MTKPSTDQTNGQEGEPAGILTMRGTTGQLHAPLAKIHAHRTKTKQSGRPAIEITAINPHQAGISTEIRLQLTLSTWRRLTREVHNSHS